MKPLPPFDKYDHYFRSVQDPDQTIAFVDKIFAQTFGQKPHVYGEDFCGTFAMSCAWVKKGKERHAVGVDLDAKPITYGMKQYFSVLAPAEQKRLKIIQADVRSPRLPKVDVIGSMNFSYFIFKQRRELLAYFKNCYRRLNSRGMLVLDCFGGTETVDAIIDRSVFEDFVYYWDQMGFDPITHEALFHIHYKRRGEKLREKVFTYDWRMWGLPELRDLLEEARFRNIHVYWEGTDRKGEGNGKFTRKKHEKNCPGWIAYVSATR